MDPDQIADGLKTYMDAAHAHCDAMKECPEKVALNAWLAAAHFALDKARGVAVNGAVIKPDSGGGSK